MRRLTPAEATVKLMRKLAALRRRDIRVAVGPVPDAYSATFTIGHVSRTERIPFGWLEDEPSANLDAWLQLVVGELDQQVEGF